jgi:hypothetical protein
MKNFLAFVAILAATIGTAAAQRSSGNTAGNHPGGNANGANGNNNVSSGNATNTSSSAANNNPTTASPNYKPAAKPRGTGTDTKKPAGGDAASGAKTKVVVSSGGQGHNTTPDPKGKTMVAPSATTSGKGKK